MQAIIKRGVRNEPYNKESACWIADKVGANNISEMADAAVSATLTGFCSGRSYVDNVFVLNHLDKEHRMFNISTYVTYVDL